MQLAFWGNCFCGSLSNCCRLLITLRMFSGAIKTTALSRIWRHHFIPHVKLAVLCFQPSRLTENTFFLKALKNHFSFNELLTAMGFYINAVFFAKSYFPWEISDCLTVSALLTGWRGEGLSSKIVMSCTYIQCFNENLITVVGFLCY